MRIGGSILDRISLGQGKIRLQLGVSRESKSKGVILTVDKNYYLPNSISKLVSLIFLNNNKIYLQNKYKTFYNSNIKEILASMKRWKKGFLLKLLNLWDAAMHLTQANKKIYQSP